MSRQPEQTRRSGSSRSPHHARPSAIVRGKHAQRRRRRESRARRAPCGPRTSSHSSPANRRLELRRTAAGGAGNRTHLKSLRMCPPQAVASTRTESPPEWVGSWGSSPAGARNRQRWRCMGQAWFRVLALRCSRRDHRRARARGLRCPASRCAKTRVATFRCLVWSPEAPCSAWALSAAGISLSRWTVKVRWAARKSRSGRCWLAKGGRCAQSAGFLPTKRVGWTWPTSCKSARLTRVWWAQSWCAIFLLAQVPASRTPTCLTLAAPPPPPLLQPLACRGRCRARLRGAAWGTARCRRTRLLSSTRPRRGPPRGSRGPPPQASPPPATFRAPPVCRSRCVCARVHMLGAGAGVTAARARLCGR